MRAVNSCSSWFLISGSRYGAMGEAQRNESITVPLGVQSMPLVNHPGFVVYSPVLPAFQGSVARKKNVEKVHYTTLACNHKLEHEIIPLSKVCTDEGGII